MSTEKLKTECTSCETKYTVEWNINQHDLLPTTCPFCGFEIETDEEEVYDSNNEDDSWD